MVDVINVNTTGSFRNNGDIIISNRGDDTQNRRLFRWRLVTWKKSLKRLFRKRRQRRVHPEMVPLSSGAQSTISLNVESLEKSFIGFNNFIRTFSVDLPSESGIGIKCSTQNDASVTADEKLRKELTDYLNTTIPSMPSLHHPTKHRAHISNRRVPAKRINRTSIIVGELY